MSERVEDHQSNRKDIVQPAEPHIEAPKPPSPPAPPRIQGPMSPYNSKVVIPDDSVSSKGGRGRNVNMIRSRSSKKTKSNRQSQKVSMR